VLRRVIEVGEEALPLEIGIGDPCFSGASGREVYSGTLRIAGSPQWEEEEIESTVIKEREFEVSESSRERYEKILSG